MQDIAQWLGDIGLGQYAQSFLDDDIDLEIVSELTEADLEKLGLSLGHPKRFLRAVASLRTPRPAEALAGKLAEVAGTGPSVTVRPDAQRRQLTVIFFDLGGSTPCGSEPALIAF